ncbi:unnamed protein product [marine sediment metagenome]|uniref:Desulfoferrodoxin ferrous iron-binding domain-containing protein n=1 Tax=marine sediment metagenome TaxID=412755 RepID=X1CTB0_9ZZZZ
MKEWTCESDMLCGVNEPKDKENPTDLEKKHVPYIDAPEQAQKDKPFDVTIEIGRLLEHPNEPAHFIEWLELYCGDTFLGRTYFSGGISYPEARFKVKLSHAHGPLKVWVKCNLYGIWESTKEIKIVG